MEHSLVFYYFASTFSQKITIMPPNVIKENSTFMIVNISSMQVLGFYLQKSGRHKSNIIRAFDEDVLWQHCLMYISFVLEALVVAVIT